MVNFQNLAFIIKNIDEDANRAVIEWNNTYKCWVTSNIYEGSCSPGDLVLNKTDQKIKEDNNGQIIDYVIFYEREPIPLHEELGEAISEDYKRIFRNEGSYEPSHEAVRFMPYSYYCLVMDSNRNMLPLPLLQEEEVRAGDPVLEELHHKLLHGEEEHYLLPQVVLGANVKELYEEGYI